MAVLLLIGLSHHIQLSFVSFVLFLSHHVESAITSTSHYLPITGCCCSGLEFLKAAATTVKLISQPFSANLGGRQLQL